jgi:hypothetical protein
MTPKLNDLINLTSETLARLLLVAKDKPIEFVDFAARCAGIVKAAEKLQAECASHIKDDLLQGAPGSIAGDSFRADVTLVNSFTFNQTAFAKAEPAIFEAFKQEKTASRLTFSVR